MPPGTLAFIRSHPILKLTSLQIDVDPGLWDVERQLDLLAANGVRYVVLHKQPLPPQPPIDAAIMADWRALFGPEVHYEDDELAVYRLSPGQNAPPILRLGNLGLLEARLRRTWVLAPDVRSGEHPEEWAIVELTWTALDDLRPATARSLQSAGALSVGLALLGPEGLPVSTLGGTPISPRYPTSRWPQGVVVADRYALPLAPEMPAGAYRLRIVLLDETTGLPLAQSELPVQLGAEAEPLVPALAEMAQVAGVSYGGELRLLGYTTRAEGGQLHVDLYWLAERAPALKLKFFVHLVQDRDGAIVAQHDAMPRHWSYPTDLWNRGEVFVERIALDVSQAAPGPYHLAVGVYSVESGRLQALDRDGQRLPDDQGILGIGELGN